MIEIVTGGGMPAPGPRRHAGKCARAYLYFCAGCTRNEVVYALHRHVDLRDGDREIRKAGWSHTRDGWRCPYCK